MRLVSSLVALVALVGGGSVLTSVGCGSSDSEFGNGNGDGTPTDDGNKTLNGFGPGAGGEGGAGPCVGLECQQVACSGGGTTSLSGTVFAPNGTLPLYNAIVYVPNAPVDPFPTTGVTCDKCGTSPSGKPIATALTDADGKFVLKNVPVGDNIPVVIQIGKWRRQVVVPSVAQCVDTPLTADNTRLPKNSSEGDIPKIAIATGGADSLECFFRKLGVEQSEFTNGSGAGRIHLYNGVQRGAVCQRWTTTGTDRWVNRDFAECTATEINKAEWAGANPTTNNVDYRIVPDIADGISDITGSALSPAVELWGAGASGSTGYSCAGNGFAENKRCASSALSWPASGGRLMQYDMVVLSCEGAENNATKDDAARAALRSYMDNGGRVFNSHFHYTWLKNPTATNPLNATAVWTDNSTRGDQTTRIDQTFVKGQAFATWMRNVGAATQDGSGNTNSDMKELRKNVLSVPSPSLRWIYEPGDADAVKFYSFNSPLGAAADAQCGRAVYTDIHVSSGDSSGGTFPNNCTTLNNGLSNQEKALLFLMMDLSSCIQDDSKPPVAPPPVVK